MLFFNLQRFKDFPVFLLDFGGGWIAVVYVAEDLEGFVVAAVFVEVAGGLGEAEDEDDYALKLDSAAEVKLEEVWSCEDGILTTAKTI